MVLSSISKHACSLSLCVHHPPKALPYTWLTSRSQMFYCIPLPIISCLQEATRLQSPCSSYMAMVTSTAFSGFQPDIQICPISTSAPSEAKQEPVPQKGLNGQSNANKFHFSLLLHGRNQELDSFPLTMLCKGRGRARVSNNTPKFLSLWNVTSCWLTFAWSLQILNQFLELPQRYCGQYVIYFGFPFGNKGLEYPSPPSY